NSNPFETLEEGEEYTSILIDALSREDYQFTYKLTDFEDKPITDSIVWMHIGFMPKSRTRFINERANPDELGNLPYFESLGTDELSFIGPGVGLKKMYGKPLIYERRSKLGYYGPYFWKYGKTNELGKVSFNISFDDNYITDFIDIFGSMEGFSSIEDTVLYMRVFTTPFDGWDYYEIANPDLFICSRDGSVFDGNDILEDYDLESLKLQDRTYVEGLIHLHKKDIALGIVDYLTYNLPDPNIEEDPGPFDSIFEPLTISVRVTEANPLPNTEALSVDTLTRNYEITELEPIPVNILYENYQFYAKIDVINPSGYLAEAFQDMKKPIYPRGDEGTITFSKWEMEELIWKLGPGLSTFKIQVEQSEYYKSSPIVNVPLEVRPPNWIKFGEKNTRVDLIDPFINAWGSTFDGNNFMPFESNYPHLMGTFWVDPNFNGPAGEEELSIQDYISIDLMCKTYDQNGYTSEFPLREGVTLRPLNHDGIMKFDVGLGPEDAFLMGLSCNLTLFFDITNIEDKIYKEDYRDINIFLLDLRLEKCPSSSTSETLWSLYNNGYDGNVAGINDLFSFDMGGTTAKSCLVREGRIEKVSTYEVARIHRFKKGSGYPIQMPVIDMLEIGAGGGSIAKVSKLGLLQVGPESAGADPGPVCYSRGGQNPTVTDADLLLGYLDPKYFLGGEIELNKKAAETALDEVIAKPLGVTLEEAAWGIHELINETMASAAKIHIAERGGDTSKLTIVAFGGAGPVHAYGFSKKLGVRNIIIPVNAGVCSAFGFFVTPFSYDISQTHKISMEKADFSEIEKAFGNLEKRGYEVLREAGKTESIASLRSIDCRYVGQGYEINVTLPRRDFDSLTKRKITKLFEDNYERIYGRVYPGIEVEILNLRVNVKVDEPLFFEHEKPPKNVDSVSDAIKGVRKAYSQGHKSFLEFTVYDRYKLFSGARFDGPAIIEEKESTTIIDSDCTLSVDDFGIMTITY
ncbi:MAG: hydantoinase/oxoprolinase family protein, partial [Candidatus Hodarchaeota archaeon]